VAVRLALDTNRYTDLARGDAELARRLEQAEAVFLPFVVVAELRAGFAVGKRGRDNEGALRRFLVQPGVDVLFADDATTVMYATLFRQLRAQGTPIPTNDLWIAALALQHGLALCSRDRHFGHIGQLALA
jgi:tRNA(fMet)-specific endonuclease VapC